MGTLAATVCGLKDGGKCVVRHAVAGDAARVLECAREAFATSVHTLTKLDEFVMTEDAEREFLVGVAAHPRQLFLVAETGDSAGGAGGEMIGLLNLRQNTARRKLRHSVEMGMSVHSAHRGRGVGHAMLREAIAWAEGVDGLEQMTLAVYADNAAGLALYRRCGFVEYGRLPGGLIHDDGSAWEQVLMWRAI